MKHKRIGCAVTAAVMGMQLAAALPVTAMTVPDAAEAGGTELAAFAAQICALTQHDEDRSFFGEACFDPASGTLTADGEPVGICGGLTVSGGDLMICSSAPESDTVQTAGVFRRFADAAAEYGYESETDGGVLTVTNEFQTARLIVKAAGEIDLHGARETVEGYRNLHILQYASTAQAYAAYQQYQQDPAVQYVQPSHIVTLDTTDTSAFSSAADAGVSSLGTGSYMSWGADLIGTEDFYNTYLKNRELPEIKVAVIDSGLNAAPALFEGRILEGGVNFSGSGDDSIADDLSHGTHVTGTICELTPENVKILPIKSFNNKGTASDEQIYAGIMYALENGADVLNMSFGGLGVNPLEVEAMMTAEKNGIICCAAAGNNADDARYYYPSSIESCITVGAVDAEMERASFSNFGEMLDVTAPGVDILSYGIENETKQETKSGTSMSTPHVTACCALLCCYDPEITSARAENLLCLNAVDLGDPGFDDDTGWGMVCMKDFRWDAGICKAPEFSKEEGNYGNAQTIEITAEHPEMQIYYTTDGSLPTRENGTLYTEPLNITESTRVRAVAVRKDYVDSVPVTAVFTIGGKDIPGALTIENGIVTSYRGIRQRVTIPETADGVPVTAIAGNAFAENQFVEKVVLPESVTVIGSGAFRGCELLAELEAPGVTKIGDAAFAGDAALETVKLNPGLTAIGSETFADCTALTALSMPQVEQLPGHCLARCTALKKLEIPAVTVIGGSALEDCTALREIVTDWRRITVLGKKALAGCKSFAGNLMLDSLEMLSPGVFSGDTALLRVSLPESMDEIPEDVFRNCSGLRLLEIPGAEVLGSHALAIGSSRENLRLVMNFGIIRSLGADAMYGLRLGNGFDTVTFSALKTLEPHSFGGAIAGIVELPLVKQVPGNAFAGAVIYGAGLDAAETLESGSLFGLKSVRLTSAAKTVAQDACPTETWVVSAEQLPALADCQNVKPCYEPLVMRVSTLAMNLRQYACGTFRVSALGDGLTYQWYRVNEGETAAIPGATRPEYIPESGTQGEFVYRCEITDAAGKQELCDVKAIIGAPAEYTALEPEQPYYASGTELRHFLLTVPESGSYVLEATGDAPVAGILTNENGVYCGSLAVQQDRSVLLTADLEAGKQYYLDALPHWDCDYALRLTASMTARTPMEECTVTVQNAAFGQYDPAYHPPLKITAPDGSLLTEGTDYTVRTTRANMHYQLTVFGTGAYKGSVIVRTDLIDRIPEDTPVPMFLSGKEDYATVLFIPKTTGTYYFYGGVDPRYLDEWKSYSTTGRVPNGYVYSNVTASCQVSSQPAGKGIVYKYESKANWNEGQFCGSMQMNAGQMYYFTCMLRENRDAGFTFVVSDRLRNIRDAELDGNFSAAYKNGQIYEPETELIYEDAMLTEGVDYLVLHGSNFAPGQAELTLIGTGLFIGKVSRKYEIIFPMKGEPGTPVPLWETTAVSCDTARMQTVWFRAELAENAYSNMRYRVLNEQTSGTEMLYRVYRYDEQLRSMVLMQPMQDDKNDYLLKNGLYCVCCTRKFRDRTCAANITVVAPYSIQDAKMTITDAVYTGGAVEEPVTLTMPDGTVLKRGRDYVIAYPEDDLNVMFGEVPFTIRSTKYSYGNGEGTYQIKVQLPENPPELTIGQHEVCLTKTERLGWYQLTAEEDTEYLLASDDIPDAVLRVFTPDTKMDAQTHGSGPKALTFTVPAGQTRYIMVKYNGLARTGTLHFRLETEQKALASCEVDAQPVYWTGDHVKPDIRIRDGEYTLVEGEDYAQRYIINDVDIGMASVNYVGKGKYVGMLDVDFQIRMEPVQFWRESRSGTWMPLMPLMLDYEYQIKNTDEDRYLLYSYYSVFDTSLTLTVFDARCKLAVQAYDEEGQDIGDAFINREGELTVSLERGHTAYFLFSATDISGTNQQWKMQLFDQPIEETVIVEDKENGLYYRALAKPDEDYAEIYRLEPGRSTYRFESSIMSEEYGYKKVHAINPGVFAMIPKSAVVYGGSTGFMTRYADYYHYLFIPLPYSSNSISGTVEGDLNMDGEITESDIVLFNALLAEHPAVDPDLINMEADMDHNGVLDFADLRAAQAMITEFADKVPIYGGDPYYPRS